MTKLAFTVLGLVALLPVVARGQQVELTTISRGLGGLPANGESRAPAVSEDGRWIAFRSLASNLVPGDTNGVADVFLLDRTSGTTILVSVSVTGAPSNGESFAPSVSANGRHVAFSSSASNLVGGDTNSRIDVFVRDTVAGSTVLASRSSVGLIGNGDSDQCSLSLDGRRLAFRSAASNLVAGDTNGRLDIFLRDLAAGTTLLLSSSSSGTLANGNSLQPALSGDGRFAVFASDASNLVSSDTNATRDIFLRDIAGSTTLRLSRSLALAEGNGPSTRPSISRDGRWIAFESSASNLVAGDIGSVSDIFLATSNLDTLVQVTRGNGASSEAVIARDGSSVAFTSVASDLLPGDMNARADIFTYAPRTGALRIESSLPDGVQGNGDSASSAVAYTSGVIVFGSAATNLSSGDTNAALDVFCVARELAPAVTVTLPAGLDVTDACMASGDFDGDGFDELFLGCPLAVGPTGSPEGCVLIYRGTATSIESQPAWTLYGGQAGSRFGFALASAVDTDNDCRQDLLVGAPAYDNGELDEGAVFFYRGRPAGTPISGPDDTGEGNEPAAEYGHSVSFARVPSLPDCWQEFDRRIRVVGAPGAGNARGRIYIDSEAFEGDLPGDRLGTVVLGLDAERCFESCGQSWINADAYVAASAPGKLDSTGRVGSVRFFITHGTVSGGSWTFAEHSTVLGGQPDAQFGVSMVQGPDIDGDGHSEVVVGSPLYSTAEMPRCGRLSWVGFAGRIYEQLGSHMHAQLGHRLAAAVDFRNDGSVDVVTAQVLGSGPSASAFLLTEGEPALGTEPLLLATTDWVSGSQTVSLGGGGRRQSRCAFLSGAGNTARLWLANGQVRDEPCRPFLTSVCGGGPMQDYTSCSGWDSEYGQGCAVVNPTCEAIMWSIAGLPSHFYSNLPPASTLAPMSMAHVSMGYGQGDSLFVDCGQCFNPGAYGVDFMIDGQSCSADFRAGNVANCYDLGIDPWSSPSVAIDCAAGETSATIAVNNHGCNDVYWTADPIGVSWPAGVSVTLQPAVIPPMSSGNIEIQINCSNACSDFEFRVFVGYTCDGPSSGMINVHVNGFAPCYTSYCLPGTSVGGCNAMISASGVPSSPNALPWWQVDPFVIRMMGIPAQRSALMFYGLSAVNWPWGPTSSSRLCVAYPVERLGLDVSLGSLGACDGEIAVDLNAFMLAHPAALGAPFAVGQDLFVQGWYRDPGASRDTNLSDALKVTIWQ